MARSESKLSIGDALSDAFDRVAAWRGYDFAMRLPVVLWATIVVTLELAGIRVYIDGADWAQTPFVAGATLAARLALVLFIVSLAAFTILRSPPRSKSPGIEPRVSALLGSFLAYGFVLFPRHELTTAGGIASTLLLLSGNALAICVVLRLGRSFSVMAEARQLVTTGAYRIVRHPLYLAEAIATLGAFLQFASVWTGLLLVCQLAFQLRRMGHEERILAAQFPNYPAYCASTARLVPGLY